MILKIHYNVYMEIIVLNVVCINCSRMVSLPFHFFFFLFNLCDNCSTLISNASSFAEGFGSADVGAFVLTKED